MIQIAPCTEGEKYTLTWAIVLESGTDELSKSFLHCRPTLERAELGQERGMKSVHLGPQSDFPQPSCSSIFALQGPQLLPQHPHTDTTGQEKIEGKQALLQTLGNPAAQDGKEGFFSYFLALKSDPDILAGRSPASSLLKVSIKDLVLNKERAGLCPQFLRGNLHHT